MKYALAGVFVEILVPVAATAKREFHIPALKNFIDLLYPYAFDMSKKNKHLHVRIMNCTFNFVILHILCVLLVSTT